MGKLLLVGLVEVIVQLEKIKLKLHECYKRCIMQKIMQMHVFYRHRLPCYVSHPSW